MFQRNAMGHQEEEVTGKLSLKTVGSGWTLKGDKGI